MRTLVNPFEIHSEKRLFIFGIIFFLIAAYLSAYSSLLIFGSLKVINNYKQTFPSAILNIAITLLSNALVLYMFARLRYIKTRFIDILNVVLIAHVAIYVLLFLTSLPVVQNAITAVELEILDKGFVAPKLSKFQTFTLGFFAISAISIIIYFFYLLIVGMKIAMNSKSTFDSVLVILLVFVWNTLLQFFNPFI